MIYSDVTITVKGNTATLDNDLYLYKNDKNITINISIVNSIWNFAKKLENNIIEKTEATFFTLRWMKGDKVKKVFEDQQIKKGKCEFVITEELIDEDIEMGDYDFQISLLDEEKNSILSIPPVIEQIHINKHIFEDEDINTVGNAKVGIAKVGTYEQRSTENSEGLYNKKTWQDNEVITKEDLNTIEEGIYNNSTQCKDIAKKTIVEGNKIYLAKNDGTKLDEGTVLPCSSDGTGGATVIASKLNGVKIGVLGDSVSAGNYHCYGDENADVKTWHEFIADKTGAIINNVSRGGSSLTTVKGDNYSFVDRYNNLDSDCKIILIFGGINDYAYAGNTELGNIGDTDTTNICGALKTLCEGLINKYPATPIGFILPYGFNEYKGSGTWKPYENKIIEVLNYYGIPYLNLRTNSIMNANIDFINSKYFRYSSADSVTGDKTHPNTAGHSIIAKPILSFIEDIYYDMYSIDIPSEVLPTSISIRETLAITPGEQSTLAVTYIPSTTTNKYLTWSSDNKSVATVSNGVVTGVGKGSCNIIATTSNGKTATCVVTVGNQSTSNYITEGLTNFWNPAGQEQQTTNWSDEIGNKVATISGLDYTQEGFEGNKLKLRAELSSKADSSSLNVPFEITENCTFEIALKYSTLSNNVYKIADMLEIYTSNSFGLRVTLNGSANKVFNATEYTNLPICSIALTKEGSNIKVIVNGVEKIVGTADTSSGTVNFFSNNKAWQACNDDIYSIKVYNRALNNDELLQNYEYYKTLV